MLLGEIRDSAYKMLFATLSVLEMKGKTKEKNLQDGISL